MDTKTTTAMTQSEHDGLAIGDRVVRLSTGRVWVVTQILCDGQPCVKALKGDRGFGASRYLTKEAFGLAR
jgi:hypothetical protein